MEKAIDIKRRAQRCVQNGDLDGALKEYEKLIAIQDSDPYNFVLLADLLFKKGDQVGAAQRYVAAIDAYEKAMLYKNAIAVGKKMMRLTLSPTLVLKRLASLHASDGLGTEAALLYQQYAEHLLREHRTTEAADALRKAFEASPDNVKALERLADVLVLDGDNESAGRTLAEAAVHYQTAGRLQEADRCRVRATSLGGAAAIAGAPGPAAPTLSPPATTAAGPGAGDGGFEIERSHMTSISSPAPPVEDIGIDRGPAVPDAGEPSKPAESAPSIAPSEISHSMEIAPSEAGSGPVGPPALDPSEMTGPPPAEPAPAHVGPPPLGAPAEAALPEPVEMPVEAATPAPAAPGLRFDGPAAESTDGHAPATDGSDEVEILPRTPADEPPVRRAAPKPRRVSESAAVEKRSSGKSDAATVERLLREAREQFRQGERDAASLTLVRAARAYDDIGQYDSAAAIYRNMARSPNAPAEVMSLWLSNCEARSDRVEAAQVACELGDRSLNEGDTDGARDWFRRASGFDASNVTAKRRLARLNDPTGAVTTESPAPETGEGRVEIAVGRSEAVTFDLGSLVSEFQRGVESQISGDAQGHYDLGMAYREMGLLEQAITSFREAGRDPAFAQRCAEMTGRSMLDQGRFEEAAQEFIVALELPGLTPEGGNDLRFQLGLAYEAAGRGAEALAEFERVYASSPGYPDVALKIRQLRQSPGSG